MRPDPSCQSDYFLPIEDKLQFLRECICEVEDQVSSRWNQKEAFIGELEQKICDVRTAIYGLGDQSPSNPQRFSLELEINNLEKEMRQQALECWRDVNGLKRELRQLEKEYLAVRGVLCSVPKR